MVNKKIRNFHKFNNKEWTSLILGIRKILNLSQNQLARKLGLYKNTIMKYENYNIIPRRNSLRKVIRFVIKNNLDINKVINLGNSCVNGFSKDTKIPRLDLEFSEGLAELIGIILGDGEILKYGTIRISFDPKKDKNFLFRRVLPLIKNLLGNNIYYESHKRIAFYNVAFRRFLQQKCDLNYGSKFRNNWGIPKWCFKKKEYLAAVLRGLFDTDGYIGYLRGKGEIMFGRFSDKCTILVNDIGNILDFFNIKNSTQHTPDGRFKIRITNKKGIVMFFNLIGSSNLRNIVRFLLF